MSSWNREVSAFGCFHQIGRLLIIRLLIPRPGAHRSVYAVQNYGFDLFCSLDKVSLTIQAFLWITIQALLLGTTQAIQGPIFELLPMKPNVFFYLQKHCWLCVRSHLYSCLPPPSFFSFYWGSNGYIPDTRLLPDIFLGTQPGSVLKIIGYRVTRNAGYYPIFQVGIPDDYPMTIKLISNDYPMTITNFWSIFLDDHWSKKIYRRKMIV